MCGVVVVLFELFRGNNPLEQDAVHEDAAFWTKNLSMTIKEDNHIVVNLCGDDSDLAPHNQIVARFGNGPESLKPTFV